MKLVSKNKKGNVKNQIASAREMAQKSRQALLDIDSTVDLIQQLIPLGLLAVENALQQEVLNLAGDRYGRGREIKRWGSNPGSVFLGDQKVRIVVPRVRNVVEKVEVPLQTYEGLKDPGRIERTSLARVLNGMSCRNYEKASEAIPQTFGIKKNAVSRKFIQASSKKLKELSERDLSRHDFVAVFIDGKTFAENELIIALGVTIKGEKIVLGFIESSTENNRVCKQFIGDLIERGLDPNTKILFVIDGSKGLFKGIKSAMGENAVIQRCQWHKRENVVSHLDKKSDQSRFRKKLQNAYNKPTYNLAKQALLSIGKELKLINESAYRSLLEGLDETLTLHRLGLYKELGISFKTTNCIESVNSQISRHTDRVCYWKNSNQRQRWVASALLEIEPTLRRVKGCRFLPALRMALEKTVSKVEETRAA